MAAVLRPHRAFGAARGDTFLKKGIERYESKQLSASGTWSKGPFRDCFLLPSDATAEVFAYHLHSDIRDGFLHGIDCRTDRQVGTDTVLDHRDVVEIVSTNQ